MILWFGLEIRKYAAAPSSREVLALAADQTFNTIASSDSEIFRSDARMTNSTRLESLPGGRANIWVWSVAEIFRSDVGIRLRMRRDSKVCPATGQT